MKKSYQLYYTLVLACLCSVLAYLCTSCDSTYEYPNKYTFPYNLRFTDNTEFVYGEAEKMSVNGSAQTITLTLASRLDQKNSMPDEYSVNVYQLSSDFQKWIETDTSSSYYSISTFKDNETPGIKIELKENSTGEDRTIRLIIESNIGYGIVDLTQQSFSTTTYSFFSKAKYKGRIYTSDAEITVSGDIIYFDPEYACLMEKIDTMDNITMMIMDDSTIFYYDKEDRKANKPYEDIISLDNSVEQYFGAATRADGFEYDDPSYLGYIAIFDNDNFKGSKITKGLTNFHFSYSLQDLKQYSDLS